EASIARTVAGMSTTTPLRSPVEGSIPTARISTCPTGPRIGSPGAPEWASSSPETSPTTVQIFVVPISSPTMISLLATNDPSVEQVPADHGKVPEDASSQGDPRRQVEPFHADLVPQRGEEHGHDHVDDEPGEEDVIAEFPFQPG